MTGPATPPTVLHVGLHKTATTSLQMNLFRRSGRPYFGLHGAPGWETARRAWFPALMSGGDLPAHAAGKPFVFSDESILLRAGGLAGATALATSIRDRLPNARLVLTVRKPSALLVSTYFQSLRVRRIAIGFRDGRALQPSSLRFTDFGQWWALAQAHRERSVAGLIDYPELLGRLRAVLGQDAVEVLAVEWIRQAPERYAAALGRLGFADAEVASFLSAPAENTRASKSLDRARPWAFAAGRRLASADPQGKFGQWLPGPAKALLERALYSAPRAARPVGGPEPELLARIDALYAPGWDRIAAGDLR